MNWITQSQIKAVEGTVSQEIQFFFHQTTCRGYGRVLITNSNNLNNIRQIFEIIYMLVYQGQEMLFDKKTQRLRISWHCPFKCNLLRSHLLDAGDTLPSFIPPPVSRVTGLKTTRQYTDLRVNLPSIALAFQAPHLAKWYFPPSRNTTAFIPDAPFPPFLSAPLHLVNSFKGTVARDCNLWFFSWIDPIWAPGSHPKIFSNLQRYSYSKVKIRESALADKALISNQCCRIQC
jgi:hypothetical protein